MPSNQQNQQTWSHLLVHYGPPSTETPTTETTTVWCHKNSWIYLTSTCYWWLFETDDYSKWKKHYSHSTNGDRLSWLVDHFRGCTSLCYVSNDFLQPINDGVVLLVFGLTSLGPGTHSLDLGLWCRVLGVMTTSRRCCSGFRFDVGWLVILVYLSLSAVRHGSRLSGLRRRSSSAAFCHRTDADVRCETNLQQLCWQVFCSCRSKAVEQPSN